MSNIMKALLDRRNDLRGELSALPEFREYELLEVFIRQYEAIGHVTSESVTLDRPKRRRRTSKLTVTDAAGAAIEDSGQPMPVRDLYDALPRYGKTATGKRPLINLSSAMSRDKRFESVTWRGVNAWWFREREIPSEADASGESVADVPPSIAEESEATENYHAA